MALFRGKCGDYMNLPEEAMRSQAQFRRWFKEHHWPFCTENVDRVAPIVITARRKQIAEVRVVRFTGTFAMPGVEIIPEHDAGVWRVRNLKGQCWPIVREGDWLIVSDLNDVWPIDEARYLADFEPVLDKPLEPAPADPRELEETLEGDAPDIVDDQPNV